MQKSKILNFVGSVGSSVTVGLCPVCIPAIGGLLSAIGLGFMVQEAVLKPLLIVLILFALFGFYWSYIKEHKNIWPLIMGIPLGISLYVGRYVYIGSTINIVLMYGGIAGILTVSVWNLKLKKKSGCPSCIEEPIVET